MLSLLCLAAFGLLVLTFYEESLMSAASRPAALLEQFSFFFFAVGTYLRITIVKVKKRNSSFYFSFISLPSRFFFFSPFFSIFKA